MTLYELLRAHQTNFQILHKEKLASEEEIHKVFDDYLTLFEKYEGNPILHDALLGRQSITESLEELAEINRGARRFLPHRKNKTHNERVEQMGELVNVRRELKTNGIFYPDNALINTLWPVLLIGGMTAGLCCLIGDMTEYQRKFAIVYPSLTIPILSIFSNCVLNRTRDIPIDETRYLDLKMQQAYGQIVAQG